MLYVLRDGTYTQLTQHTCMVSYSRTDLRVLKGRQQRLEHKAEKSSLLPSSRPSLSKLIALKSRDIIISLEIIVIHLHQLQIGDMLYIEIYIIP